MIKLSISVLKTYLLRQAHGFETFSNVHEQESFPVPVYVLEDGR